MYRLVARTRQTSKTINKWLSWGLVVQNPYSILYSITWQKTMDARQNLLNQCWLKSYRFYVALLRQHPPHTNTHIHPARQNSHYVEVVRLQTCSSSLSRSSSRRSEAAGAGVLGGWRAGRVVRAGAGEREAEDIWRVNGGNMWKRLIQDDSRPRH